MPQLDPSGFSPQIVWLAITFVVLYLIMARSALPKVSQILEERENRIADDLDQTEILKRDAEELEATYEKAVADARAEASSILQTARDDLQGKLDARRADADAGLGADIAEAEAKIAEAKAAAMAGLEDMSVEACNQILEKLTGKAETDKKVRAAVKSAIEASLKGRAS